MKNGPGYPGPFTFQNFRGHLNKYRLLSDSLEPLNTKPYAGTLSFPVNAAPLAMYTLTGPLFSRHRSFIESIDHFEL
jgi:hypothetical protein